MSSELPLLRADTEYPDEVLGNYPQPELNDYRKRRAKYLDITTSKGARQAAAEERRRKEPAPQAGKTDKEMQAPAPAAAAAIVPPPAAVAKQGEEIEMEEGEGSNEKTLIKRRASTFLQTGRNRPVLAGDKQDIIKGYKAMSLCNTLIYDALQRAELAVNMLDKKHARVILARLQKAGITNANAAHSDLKEITFKKVVSIALQAERWVYEAQAAAAKHMVKESKACLHNLAGKRKLTKEEKEERWAAAGKGDRGSRTDRAIAKAELHLEKLRESKAEQAARPPKKKKAKKAPAGQ